MEPQELDFLTEQQLLDFFHCNKSEMSCMGNPQLFLNQLRDHDLIPEDRYKKLSRMKSKENLIKALYDFLDWFERHKSQLITVFWKCVFREAIMGFYPTLKRLHNNLFDGSFHFHGQRLAKEEKPDDEREMKEPSDEEKSRKKSVKKKKKKLKRTVSCDAEEEEEEPGPSSRLTPNKKKRAKKIIYASPLRKGEKGDIWTWPIYKSQLPVNCGHVEGMLQKDKLAKGEKCILAEKQWFTPGEFEKFAGKGSYKNWKMSIQCMGTRLGKLIQGGHLNVGTFKKASKKVKKLLFSSVHSISDSEDEDEDEEEEVEPRSPDTTEDDDEKVEKQSEHSAEAREKTELEVRCGELTGMLYKHRFARGYVGKSIRTDMGWMCPDEFAKKALRENYTSWRKDITYKGQPLIVLLEDVLQFHSVLCICDICKPEPKDLENEKNDDQCCICQSDDGQVLVECDHCPRSFHQYCHLPYVDDDTVRDEQKWMCTFCVFKVNQEYQDSDVMETEAVLSNKITGYLMQCQYLILHLFSADKEQIFATDPTLLIKNYSKYIKTPMWLEKVKDKLQRNQYQTVRQFVIDVQLIFTNSATYNKSNPEFLSMGDQLKQLFEEELKRVFKITE